MLGGAAHQVRSPKSKEGGTNMTQRSKSVYALILLCFLYASMGVFARYLSTSLLLMQQVYLRIFAGLVIGMIAFWPHINISKIQKISAREWALLYMRALFFYVLGVSFFTQAITLAKYANVSLIGSLPLTAMFGYVLLRDKISWRRAIYLVSASAGGVLIGVHDLTQLSVWGRGEAIALFSTIFISLSYVMRRFHTSLLNNREMTLIMFLMAGVTLLIVSLVNGDGIPQPTSGWQPGLVMVIAVAGLFNVLALFLANHGFSNIDTALASNILTLETVFALAIGFILYREIPISKEIAGGLVIVGSVIAMNQIDAREERLTERQL